jgi:hypothetical protein
LKLQWALLQILKLQWALLQISSQFLHSAIFIPQFPAKTLPVLHPSKMSLYQLGHVFLWCNIPTVPLQYTRGAEIFFTNAQIHCSNLHLNTYILRTNTVIYCLNTYILLLNTDIYCVWTLLYIESEHCYILRLNTAIYCTWTLLYIASEHCYIVLLNTAIYCAWTMLYTAPQHCYILRLNTVIYCVWTL